MDLSKAITFAHLYFLTLLSMEYVDLDKSFIGKSGSAYFYLDTQKLPIPNIEIPTKDGLVRRYTSVEGILRDELFETTFFYNGESDLERRFVPNSTDEYYIQFLPERNKSDSFAIKHNKKMYARSHDYLSDALYFMKYLKHPDYWIYSEDYDKFNGQAMEWVKEQIRAILTDLKGEYVKDMIMKDTYFQTRMLDGQEIFYIIYRWWDKVKKRSVTWVDVVNGQGNVFVALNN